MSHSFYVNKIPLGVNGKEQNLVGANYELNKRFL